MLDKLETRRGDDWRLLLPLMLEILPFLVLEFLSQNTKMHMQNTNMHMQNTNMRMQNRNVHALAYSKSRPRY